MNIFTYLEIFIFKYTDNPRSKAVKGSAFLPACGSPVSVYYDISNLPSPPDLFEKPDLFEEPRSAIFG